MKRELLTLIAGASALLAGAASAKPTSFDVSGQKVNVDMPSGWRAMTDMAGVPLTVTGPAAGENHPVLSVMLSATNAEKAKLEGDTESSGAYKKGREEWLATQEGAKALEFFPYAKVNGARAEVYSVGYRYKTAENEYTERAYIARCNNKMFYLQSQMTSSVVKASGAKMDELVKSFRCE